MVFILLSGVSGKDLFERGLYNRLTAIGFAVSLAATIPINVIVKAEARHEVLNYLDNLGTAEVSINGERATKPEAVLDVLRSM